ncbi:indolepyruvate ferredoxin oxidoreductase subunit alpha [Methanococcus maripaludis]|uniref:Indolepyruvate oxidoreductase subunit IorA n=1 Tax=Methanococcus maripaludis TaxID=39152 RepID=A0A7J9PTX5_METMI|nr:indolepyruvate ferredoxin oxidoreductase subunit alpha [Methanococcus maripaludis]MBA2869115.1 indolepyruvate ferredoxin oxidoreductase alpha subunit [Methanococcus maripaludis]
MSNKHFLMGNEAIAYGAIAAGLQFGAGYPGTPSTEVMETLIKNAKKYNYYVEWSTNEKVALETAIGASFSGASSIVTMKQVGLNVASDPLMSLTYLGIKGPLVILVTDDPGPHSSQTEQDTRSFGLFSNIPVLDPSDSQEAYEMTKYAFKISKEYETPVILRTTTRVSHRCDDVLLDELKTSNKNIDGFSKSSRWAIFPKLAAERHPILEKLQETLSNEFSDSKFNFKTGNGKIGIITSGASYHYVNEAISNNKELFSVLKIGTPHPFPENKVLEFTNEVDSIIVVEELDSYLEDQLLQLLGKIGISKQVYGKKNNIFPCCGEYSVDIVKTGINKVLNSLKLQKLEIMEKLIDKTDIISLPVRPPNLCAGCMHRTVFYAFKEVSKELKKHNIQTIFSGDIGCYTLGNAPPLELIDTCLCMGAGISIAGGISRTTKNSKNVAFIGDSTFFHSGIPAVINAVYNNADVTIAVLDNRTTAMTGHQPHPGTGKTALGKLTKLIDIEGILKSCGVEFVKTVSADDFSACKEISKEAIDYNGPSAVVFRGNCVSIVKSDKKYAIDKNKCISCKICVERLGCPAITMTGEIPEIMENCTGCGLCKAVCPADAVIEVTKQ